MRCNAIFVFCLVLGLVAGQSSNNLVDIINALSGLDQLGGLTSTWGTIEEPPPPPPTPSPVPQAEDQQQGGGLASFRAASTPDTSDLLNIWEGQSPDLSTPYPSPSFQMSVNDLANLFSAWGTSTPAQSPSNFFMQTLSPPPTKDITKQQQESPSPSPTPTPTPTPSPTLPPPTFAPIPEPEMEDIDELIDDNSKQLQDNVQQIQNVSTPSPSLLPSPLPMPLSSATVLTSSEPLPQLNLSEVFSNSNYDNSQENTLSPPSPAPLPVTRNYAGGQDVANLDSIQNVVGGYVANVSPSPQSLNSDQFANMNTNSQAITVDPASTRQSQIPRQIQEATIDPVIPPSAEEPAEIPVFGMPGPQTSGVWEASAGGSSSSGFPFNIPDNAVQIPSTTNTTASLPLTIPMGPSSQSMSDGQQQTTTADFSSSGATFIPSQTVPPSFGGYNVSPSSQDTNQQQSSSSAAPSLPFTIPFGSSPPASTPASPVDFSSLPFSIPPGATAIRSVPAPGFVSPSNFSATPSQQTAAPSFPLGYGVPPSFTPVSPAPTDFGSLVGLIPDSTVPAFMTQSPSPNSNIQGGVSDNVQGGVSGNSNIQGGISNTNPQGGIQGGVSNTNPQGGIQGGVSNTDIQGGIQGGGGFTPVTYATGQCGRSDNPGPGTLCGCSNAVACGFYACMELFAKDQCDNPDVSTPTEEVPNGYCDVTCGRCECCPSVLKQSRNLNLTVWADMLDAIELASGGGTGPASSVTSSLSNPSYTATVFVPTDEAFRKLYEEQQGQTREEFLSTIPPLQQIVQTHMLLGQAAINAQGLWDGELGYTLPTQLGGSSSAFLTIEQGNDVSEMTISSPGATARIVEPDMNGCQSVMHIIDEVLLPFEPENPYG